MDESLKKKLKDYENALKNNLFITGAEPSYEDAYLFKLFLDSHSQPSQKEYPSIWAWYSLMILFEDEVIKEWLKKPTKENENENKNKKEHKKDKKKEKENKNEHKKDNKKEKENKNEPKKDNKKENKKEEKKQEKKEHKNVEPFICDQPDNLEEKPEYKETVKSQVNKHKDEKSNVFLEINPENQEQDLDILAKKVLKEIKRSGLKWGEKYEILDKGYFKIKKLLLGMNVGMETSVQDIIDQLETWEEEIQSVDFALFSQC